MIKEIFYEAVLFFANTLGGENKKGFFHKGWIYQKVGFLDWEKTRIQVFAYKLKDFKKKKKKRDYKDLPSINCGGMKQI